MSPKRTRRAAPAPVPTIPASTLWDDAVLAVVVAAALVFSFQTRTHQYEAWKAKPERYFVDGRPLVSSLDAYYWLRLAQDRRDGTAYPGGRDPLRSFPDGTPYERPTPLLSQMLALGASAFRTDIATFGIYLVPALAGLFLVPMALYFRRIGWPAAGVLGGLLGAFGREYFTRTSIGFVDTDALNLFFPVLASLFVLLAAESQTRRGCIIHATLAGATLLSFHWWYHHPGFNVVYLGLLVLALALKGVAWRTLALAAGAFVLASNPWSLGTGILGGFRFFRMYVLRAGDAVGGATILPGIVSLVSESQRDPPSRTLALAVDPPLIALAGLALFGVAAWWHWRRLLPLLPVLVLGLLAMISGRRFAMYLAPFVGVGYGFLLTVLVRRLPLGSRAADRIRPIALHAATLAVFALCYRGTMADFVPAPALPSSTISSLERLEKRLPRHAVVMSWWDYGYALNAVGGFATYHDGSYQRVNTYLIARALASTHQEELYGTAVFIDRTGEKRIVEMLEQSPEPSGVLSGAGRTEGSIDRADVHVLLVEPMVAKYAAIHGLGTWDPKTGSGALAGYQRLTCRNWKADRLECEDMVIDTRSGHAREDLDLEKLVFIRDGRKAQVIDYPNKTSITLQVLANAQGVFGFYLLDESVFRSNFNQLYFLGEYDPTLFEPVYDAFPAARAYRLKPRE